jgi:hypothetical protein
MYLARFSYDVLPANRQRAVDLIRREVEAARREGRNARLLVPLTRGQGGAALQFEVELGKTSTSSSGYVTATARARTSAA